MSVNSRKANKLVSLAELRGKCAENFASNVEKNFLLRCEKNNKSKAKAYNNFCYIFNEDNVCVTLYKLPSWFMRKKHYNGKEKIKNVKKYIKMNKYLTI